MAKIKFKPEDHTYHSEKGELISVSKFTEQFKEKVDWKEIAKRYAAKMTKNGTPMTTAQVLKKWENKRDKAAQIGTLYHNLRENQIIMMDDPEFYGKKCNKKVGTYHLGFKESLPICEIENNTVYPELMIYDMDYMICGQSDKVIVINNQIHIWDYKTDAEISFKGFSNQWTKPKKLLPPLEHLDDCNGNIYSIKMSLYMYLLWKANKGQFKPGDIMIEHINLKRDPENDNLPILGKDGLPIVLKIDQIKLPYRKNEVISMLKTIKLNGNR
jgi:hypothetical protein